MGLPAAGFTLDATPGRHLAVLGTSPVGADVLHAAVLSLAKQHSPGTVRFVLAGLVQVADPACDDAAEALTAAGHPCQIVSTSVELRVLLAELTAGMPGGQPDPASTPTCLVVFGADAASPLLASTDPDTTRLGTEDLRDVLRRGPTHGVHLLGWWRILSRFTDDIGSSEDVACLIALNIPAGDLGSLIGDYQLTYQPRPNRALLVDRHDHRTTLIVPYVRPGTLDHLDEPA